MENRNEKNLDLVYWNYKIRMKLEILVKESKMNV